MTIGKLGRSWAAFVVSLTVIAACSDGPAAPLDEFTPQFAKPAPPRRGPARVQQ